MRFLLTGVMSLLLVIPLMSIMTMSTSPALKADPLGSKVTVVIDRLTPVVPRPGDQIRISGRVVNTSGSKIDRITVRIGIAAAPLSARSQIGDIAALPLTADPDPIDYFLDRTRTTEVGPFPAGDETPFLIEEPIDSLPLGRDGVYPVMIEVLGSTEANSNLTRMGGTRTFLPWVSGKISPSSLVWLWPLADSPAREADGVLLNEGTPISLAPGGRLHSLLSIGSAYPDRVSWIADPELLQAATDISSGYQVRTDRGLVVGDLSASAGNWLGELSSTLNAAKPRSMESAGRLPLRVIPYASVDASALERGGMGVDLVRATTMAPNVASATLGEAVSGTVYWAPFGRLNKRTADVLASSGVRTVILNGSALAPTDSKLQSTGLGVLATTFGGMNAVLMDPGLTDTLALPQTSRSQGIAMRQRFLAETLIATQLIPVDSTSKFLVAGPANIRWNPNRDALTELLAATSAAPWLRRAVLTDLIEEGASNIPRQRGGYGPRAKNSELDQEYLFQVRQASVQLASLTAVLDNPTGFSDSYAEAILRAESTAWRNSPKIGQQLIRSIRSGLTTQIDKVYALSVGTVTLSGESGLVPVTIANDLDRTVTVGVQLRGFPSARLSSEPMYGITIEPGKKVSVELDARVVGGRTLNAGVQLLTPEGLDFGKPARISLESTAYARAAAWVIAAAFIAIVVFVVVGITRRIHKATRGGDSV